jgi:hypothetical protein
MAAKYKVNDMVRISPESVQGGDELVIITAVNDAGDIPVYDWIVPERRGSVPQHLIACRVAQNVKF